MGIYVCGPPQLVILPGAQALVQLAVLVLPMLPSGEGVLVGHWQMYREGISLEEDGNKNP